MAVKVEVNENGKIEKPFPKLMISTNYDQIVFFKEYGVGQLLHIGISEDNLGAISEHWSMIDFIDFEGSIKLSND